MSEDNIRRWTAIHGDQAHDWLATLPSIVGSYAKDWGLTIDEPLSGGTVSVVVGAKRNDDPVVLKIHPPWSNQSITYTTSAIAEAAAFRYWDGKAAPQLLESDSQALLLERITTTEHSPDLSASEIAALIKQTARQGIASDFMKLGIPFLQEEISKRYWRADAQRPKDVSKLLLTRAIVMACNISFLNGLVNGRGHWELIHGDLKPKNILKRPDGSFAVIDPSPAYGGGMYDIALWAIDKPDLMLQRCGEVADHLEADPQVIGNLAMTLAIPEICLASPARASKTLERVKEISGAKSLKELEEYYCPDALGDDDFMNHPYYVAKTPGKIY